MSDDPFLQRLQQVLVFNKASVLGEAWLNELMAIFELDDGEQWFRAREMMQASGSGLAQQVEKKIKAKILAAKKIRAIAPIDAYSTSIKQIWRDVPDEVVDDAIVPDGYEIQGPGNRGAINRLGTGDKTKMVSRDPVVITRTLQYFDRNSVLLELAYKLDRAWRREIYDRSTLMNATKIVGCAAHGLPVSSCNALDLVHWIDSYEHTNRTVIPNSYVTGTMGWHGDADDPTKHGYICGKSQIGGNGKLIELYSSDGSDEIAAREVSRRGDLAGWCDAVAPLDQFPMVRVAIFAALAAPLIAILGAPNVIVEWCGETTAGKSTALLFASSVWKNTSEKLPTWNTTTVGLEAKAQILNDFPLIIDDTAQVPEAKRADLLTSAVYMLESGHSRTRASKDMTQRASRQWRTVVLSSGEYTLSDYAGTGGAAARVLTFWGAPLGDYTEEKEKLLTITFDKLRDHHGTAGPALVKWLAENREEWPELRRQYHDCINAVRSVIHTVPGIRLAPAIALLEITSRLAHRVLGVPWQHRSMISDRSMIQRLEETIGDTEANANKARKAWEDMINYAASQPSRWCVWGKSLKEGADPHGGMLGWRRVSTTQTDLQESVVGEAPASAGLLAWFPHQLKRVLEELGYPADAVLRTWRDKKVLRAERGRLNSKTWCDGSAVPLRLAVVQTSDTIYDDDSPRDAREE